MLRFIIILLLLVASVWFGIEMVRHPGYLLLVYQPWTVQMPLWFAILSFLIFLSLFYLFIDSIDKLQFLWYRLKNWQRFRREQRSYSKTQEGLSTLIEGQWKKAEQLLLAGVSQTVEPLMNYLGAAKAAHEQNAFDRRDSYIQKAYKTAPGADLAIGLTQAELDISQDRLEHALATLNHLRQRAPKHPRVLKLLEKVYVREADWKNLLALLPNLKKNKVLTAEQLYQFEKNLYCEILHASTFKDLNEVHQVFNEIPRSIKKNPEVICAYIKQLKLFPNTNLEIADLIRKTLKYHWQGELVQIYGTLSFSNLTQQLVIAGAWLKMYGNRPELLLLLGKLCVQVQLWGKAKDYFEKCLAVGPNVEASLEYGKLLEHLGEAEEAREKYRQALIDVHAMSDERHCGQLPKNFRR